MRGGGQVAMATQLQINDDNNAIKNFRLLFVERCEELFPQVSMCCGEMINLCGGDCPEKQESSSQGRKL